VWLDPSISGRTRAGASAFRSFTTPAGVVGTYGNLETASTARPSASPRNNVGAEPRRYGKPVTVVSGFDPDLTDRSDLEELASELKREVGAGGTVSDGTIEVQGDHAARMPGLLRERGFDVA